MTVENLITDAAIEIVFQNTRFGTRTPRELIAKDLDQVNRGQHIGNTMQCCLLELGLIVSVSFRNYTVTEVGKKYLEILQSNNSNSPVFYKVMNGSQELEKFKTAVKAIEVCDWYKNKGFLNAKVVKT